MATYNLLKVNDFSEIRPTTGALALSIWWNRMGEWKVEETFIFCLSNMEASYDC